MLGARRRFLVTAARLHEYKLSAAAAATPACSIETASGFRLHTDLPRAAGGANEHPQPVELMLAALLGLSLIHI